MRIAFVTYEYPPVRGGIGTYCVKLAREFKRGNVCTVFGNRGSFSDVPLFENYLVRKGAGFVNGWRVLKFIGLEWDVVFAVQVDAAYPAFLLSLFSRKPLVFAVLGNDVLMAQKDGLRRFLSGLVFRRAKRVVCISSFTESLIHKYYPNCREKTVVIHPGV